MQERQHAGMHPNMARVAEGPQYTPECCKEAANLKAYCEAKFQVGAPTSGPLSVTGQPYKQFCIGRYPTATAARIGAEGCFDEYSGGKSGTLYWRIEPEIAYSRHTDDYAFYMRLLISGKPRKH